MNGTVAERLVAFALEQARSGVPEDVSHEAQRLLLNQLKASVGATEHEAVEILHDWSAATGGEGDAAVLWVRDPNGAGAGGDGQWRFVRSAGFHDTYIPCFMHATSAVLPAVLAAAQLAGRGLDAPATAFEGDKGMRESYTDPEILALRSRIELVRDETRRSFEGCSMEIEFTDGTRESTSVDAFLGSPARRMSDEELAWIFCGSAEPVLPAGRAEEILDAVWNLDKAADIGSLMSLCRLN